MKKTFIPVLLSLILLCTCKENPAVGLTVLDEIRSPAPVRIAQKISVRLDDQVGAEPVPKLLVLPDKLLVFHFSVSGTAVNKMFCDAYTFRLERSWRKELFIGQGPGDVSGRMRFFYTQNKISALDWGLVRFSFFDNDMNYREMTKVVHPTFYNLFCDDGRHYVSVAGRRTDWILYKTEIGNSSAKQLAHFGPFPGKGFNKLTQTFIMKAEPDVLLFTHGQHVYFLNCMDYSIQRILLSGRVDAAVRLKVPKITLSEEEAAANRNAFEKQYHIRKGGKRTIYNPVVQPACGVVRLQKGFIVLRRFNYDPDCTGMMEGDYFTWDLVPKGKVQFPGFASCKGQFGYDSQASVKNGIYLVHEGEEFDTLSYWEVQE
jgi:hypothetical protein